MARAVQGSKPRCWSSASSTRGKHCDGCRPWFCILQAPKQMHIYIHRHKLHKRTGMQTHIGEFAVDWLASHVHIPSQLASLIIQYPLPAVRVENCVTGNSSLSVPGGVLPLLCRVPKKVRGDRASSLDKTS